MSSRADQRSSAARFSDFGQVPALLPGGLDEEDPMTKVISDGTAALPPTEENMPDDPVFGAPG
ncbi:MAG: hypothetical protein LC808_30110, partial [Actinobacteria bacterium]|nr:hypothetical protein [Actinomycetota bacterium]